MVTSNQLLAIDRLSKWFTPNRPIDLPEFLSGRLQLIFRIRDAIGTQGLHVILYGERGTGKTSLAHVLSHMIQEPELKNGKRSVLVSCDSSDTFETIWRKIFQEILLAQRQLGFVQQNVLTISGKIDFETAIFSPNDVRLQIKSFPNHIVIVIDEFDRLPPENNARRLMADTIKLFSDTNVNATIVIVGVAESIGELLSEHQSIVRNINQIPVEPMDNAELAEIVHKGYSNSGLSFESDLDYKIAALSQGYPHYTHLLALWAGRIAIESGHTEVNKGDLDKAIPLAITNAAGGIRQAYETAIESSQPDNLFKAVLLACALADKDSRGRFGIKGLREPLRNILNRPNIRAVAYQGHLAKFVDPKRGAILKRTGLKHNYRWQFVNPQLIPFVKLEGIKEGLIVY
jgi:Cdc6-like AAA superfamily ATPase